MYPNSWRVGLIPLKFCFEFLKNNLAMNRVFYVSQ